MQAILVGLNNSLVRLNFRRRDTAGMRIQWPIGPKGGGGELPYDGGRDAHQIFQIKHQKETNLGMAQALFDP